MCIAANALYLHIFIRDKDICKKWGRTGFDGDFVGRISKPQLLEAALKKPKLNINADKTEKGFAPQLVAA